MCKHKTADLQTPLIPESRFFLQFVKKQFFLYLFTLLFAWLELSFELN